MSLGFVSSDLATSNARVSQILTAGTARVGTLSAGSVDVDQLVTDAVDASVCNVDALDALTATVTTLNATDVQTDTETVGTLTATTLNTTDLNVSETLTAGTVEAVDVNVSGTLIGPLPKTFVGMLRNTGDGDPFDLYVVPNDSISLDGAVQASTDNQGTFCVPIDITITSFEGNSTGGVPMTFNLLYGTADNNVTTPVFPASTVTDATFSQTGSVEVQARSFLSVQFSGDGNADQTYNSWVITYH